jgi:hypothetical protein
VRLTEATDATDARAMPPGYPYESSESKPYTVTPNGSGPPRLCEPSWTSSCTPEKPLELMAVKLADGMGAPSRVIPPTAAFGATTLMKFLANPLAGVVTV